jgi:hypothetical protein
LSLSLFVSHSLALPWLRLTFLALLRWLCSDEASHQRNPCGPGLRHVLAELSRDTHQPGVCKHRESSLLFLSLILLLHAFFLLLFLLSHQVIEDSVGQVASLLRRWSPEHYTRMCYLLHYKVCEERRKSQAETQAGEAEMHHNGRGSERDFSQFSHSSFLFLFFFQVQEAVDPTRRRGAKGTGRESSSGQFVSPVPLLYLSLPLTFSFFSLTLPHGFVFRRP